MLRDATVVLRADADATIGYGHVVRLSALGVELASLGAEVRLVTRMPDPPAEAVLVPREVGLEAEAAWFCANFGAPDIVLLDTYRPEAGQIAGWKRRAGLIGVIDDSHPRFPFDVDLLVSPALTGRHSRARASTYLAGASFVLLRTDFTRVRRGPARRVIDTAIVCMGGSDPRRMTARITRWLLDLTSISHVEVIIGAGFERKRESLHLFQENPRVRLLIDEPDVAARMVSADVGVLAAGTLAYEAAASGLPCLLVSQNEAQTNEAIAIAAAGAAEHLTWSALNANGLRVAMDTLEPRDIRAAMSRSGQDLIDGAGARRVAAEVEALCAPGRRGG